jgi:two-component system chemotaxis response regulator CheB
LPVATAVDRAPLKPGEIRVAPEDHHVLIDDGVLRVVRGPPENRNRPALDPLFRSAAWSYGPRAVGVVLSGVLDDGTAGLWAIKQCAGVAIVQDPAEAEHAGMPESAIEHVPVDEVLPVAKIAQRLVELTQRTEVEASPAPRPASIKTEVDSPA